MAPSLVHQSSRRRRDGRVFVVRTDDGLVVKTRRQGPGRRLAVPQRQPEQPGLADRPRFAAPPRIGEVRWAAHLSCEANLMAPHSAERGHPTVYPQPAPPFLTPAGRCRHLLRGMHTRRPGCGGEYQGASTPPEDGSDRSAGCPPGARWRDSRRQRRTRIPTRGVMLRHTPALDAPHATCFTSAELVSTDQNTSNDWRVDLMRLTAFPAPGPPTTKAEAWWLALFGAPHEKSTRNLKNGVAQLLGTVGDAYMLAIENPISFELRQLATDPEQPPLDPDALPIFSVVEPTFQDLALRWLTLDDSPALRRLAFGATLLKPVPSIQKGYEALDGYLPDVNVAPDSSDFLYQINRRRPSAAISGLPLNRISKWSIQEMQELVFSADGHAMRRSGGFACRVELDMNCVPSKQPLPPDRLPSLFTELVALATEIAAAGDIP